MDLIGLISGATSKKKATSGIVLEIDLARGVLVAPPEHPLAALRTLNSPQLGQLCAGLRQAADDKRVQGLIVHVAPSGLDLAHLQELCLAIADFGTKKPTVAFTQTFGELGSAMSLYLVAAHCRHIWLQPSGELFLGGVHLSLTLLRGTLEKAGIEAQFGQRHEYKTAADQFVATEITDANREMSQRLADSLLDQMVADIARLRSLDPAVVRAAVDESPLTPQAALDAGLIDRVGYRDEVYSESLKSWTSSSDDLKFVARYHAAQQGRRVAKETLDRSAPVVATINLRGGIITGRGRPGSQQAAGDVIADHLRAAARDDKVKAVVLRIDSPGGSAVASDTIWREVHRVRQSGRPVVAQMGTVAASGGYYAAMAANEIVALPATLTGSIGVLGGKFITRGLFDKLALITEDIDAGARAGMMSSGRAFTDDEWLVFNRVLDEIYLQFTTKAAADRGMDYDQLEALARGRVWTGADAKERGLVDHLGGVELAVQRACALAKIDRDKARVRSLPQLGLLDRVLPTENSETAAAASLAVAADPSTELLRRGLSAVGLHQAAAMITGPLTLPWMIRIDC